MAKKIRPKSWRPLSDGGHHTQEICIQLHIFPPNPDTVTNGFKPGLHELLIVKSIVVENKHTNWNYL